MILLDLLLLLLKEDMRGGWVETTQLFYYGYVTFGDKERD